MSFVDKVPVKVFQGLEEKECPDDEDGAGDSDDDFEVDEGTYQFFTGVIRSQPGANETFWQKK